MEGLGRSTGYTMSWTQWLESPRPNARICALKSSLSPPVAAVGLELEKVKLARLYFNSPKSDACFVTRRCNRSWPFKPTFVSEEDSPV